MKLFRRTIGRRHRTPDAPAAPDLSNVIFLDDYRVVKLISTNGHSGEHITGPRRPGEGYRRPV